MKSSFPCPFLILTLLSVSSFVFAGTFIINAGGGGEPSTDGTNQFLSPLLNVETLGAKKGTVFSLFNSDTWPKDQFSKPENIKPFNEENLLSTIDTVKQQMKESEGKKQVMIHINAHGTPSDSTQTHRWSTDDNQYIDPNGNFLIKVQELLIQGANVALIDDSCFSGSSLLIFKELIKQYPDQLCVITGASQFGFGYTGGMVNRVVHNFLSSDREQNLESIFWKTYINPENAGIYKGITQTSSIDFENFLHPLEYLDFPTPKLKEPYYRGSKTIEQVPLHLQSLVCENESLLTGSTDETVEGTARVFIEMAKSEIKKAQEENIPEIKKIIAEFEREKETFDRKWQDRLDPIAKMPKTMCTEINTTTRGEYWDTYCTVGKYKMFCDDMEAGKKVDHCDIRVTGPHDAIYTDMDDGHLNFFYLSHEQDNFFNNLLRQRGPAKEYSNKKRRLTSYIEDIGRKLNNLKRKLFELTPPLVYGAYQNRKSKGEVRKACENFSL